MTRQNRHSRHNRRETTLREGGNLTKDTVGLVLASGSGTRVGLGPKAFLNLGGSNLVYRVVNTLTGCVGPVNKNL